MIVSFSERRVVCTNLVTLESPVPTLPRWAQPHDLAVVVEFSRMTQAVLEASTSRRYPTSVDVIEFVGALTVEFEARFADVTWGEDGPDFLEATEAAFEAAAKPSWWPTDEEQARRADLDYLVALARRVGSAPAQVLDADAIAQAERDDAALDAAGESIAAALEAAGIACDDWGDGIVTVRGWLPYRELRVCAGIEHDPDGDHILVDIVSSLFEEDDDGDPAYTVLADSLPVEDLDYIVERVRDIFATVGGAE
jgi:hypothetical protein